MLAALLLGVQHGAIQGNFMDTAAGRDQGDAPDGGVVIVQDLLRQTGGSSQVASRGAVFDGDMPLVSHDDSFTYHSQSAARASSITFYSTTNRRSSLRAVEVPVVPVDDTVQQVELVLALADIVRPAGVEDELGLDAAALEPLVHLIALARRNADGRFAGAGKDAAEVIRRRRVGGVRTFRLARRPSRMVLVGVLRVSAQSREGR